MTDLVCWFLLKRPPLDAFVSVDAICQDICLADPRNREKTEQRFHVFQQQVTERILELQPRCGRRRASRLVSLMTPWAASPLESMFRLIVHAFDFPKPVLQYPVRSSAGNYYIDAFFPQAQLAVELDGIAKYQGNFGVLEQEKFRELDLNHAGLRVLRFGYKMLLDYWAVAAKLNKALGLNQRVADLTLFAQWLG